LCKDKNVLVIHDGDHRKEIFLCDLRNYSSLFNTRGYIIVQDGVSDLFKAGDGIGMFDNGPLVALEQFLSENRNFVVDYECERYILTSNPKGFLKRIM
jgi:cephalosporin hydroxylase